MANLAFGGWCWWYGQYGPLGLRTPADPIAPVIMVDLLNLEARVLATLLGFAFVCSGAAVAGHALVRWRSGQRDLLLATLARTCVDAQRSPAAADGRAVGERFPEA